ncbi:hypothetical protein [Methanopyrus kandleri]|uniref:Uncharacterized protein n=1 Tax=Methanopyrus kandleri (strain AV19 / DSM 6324 / JCM 9639 / NBRC 100938) TaxID=190192 RepID=Q8TWA2_METKA|nr:hypothetical protein [Methanopyrus kandleri]AAM02347.1 Uncharacterized protein MK1134 [Methanopyrus kandleri AV19]
MPEYPKPGTVREAVYVLSVPGDRATLDLVFDVPPWARVLDLYLSAGSRVLGAGMVPRSAYSGLDHYVPAPELPGFVRLELAGERTERWSSDRFPATDPWLRGLLKRHGLRWTVVRYFLPRNGLFWARCEVPLLDGFVVWPAPFVGGYYVYGGVTEARLVPEGGPDRRLTFGPLPPLSDLDATLVLVLDGPPAVVVSSRGFHRTVLVFRPVGASPEAYRYAADPLRVALGLLGGAVSLLVRPTVPKALAALLVLVPVAGLDYRWPWLTGWATLGPAVLFLCLLHVL